MTQTSANQGGAVDADADDGGVVDRIAVGQCEHGDVHAGVVGIDDGVDVLVAIEVVRGRAVDLMVDIGGRGHQMAGRKSGCC